MAINKEQRVGVFVDVQNMYYSAKKLYKKKLDYRKLLKTAVKKRKLIRAITYVIESNVNDEKSFFDALIRIGFEVKSKELQTFPGGAKKGDWDVGIAMDMIELAPKMDVEILVSGDGDFTPLVQHLKKAMGCRIEIMSFGKSTSSKLIDVVDKFVDLDKIHKKVLR